MCYQWHTIYSNTVFHALICFRYAYPQLDGAFTYIFATNGESFDFSEIQIQGNAHLAFKAAGGDNTDSATIYASYINGDKTGNSLSIYDHLFQKNTIDNPECEYCEIENTPHFCLHCNLYGQLRHALLDRVSTYCQPMVNVFLYGNTDLTDVENAELFSAVQDYIY